MNEEILRKLYDKAGVHFNLPSFEQFMSDMQDEQKLIKFRDNMSKHYNIPNIETLKADIGFAGVKKKEDSVSADGISDGSDSAYGGTIQDFAESEEIQQMPTYQEQGQDLSPGLKEMSTSNVDFEEETVEQETVEQKEPTFSWDAGAQPTTVTATEEVQTVASDPDVGVESKQTLFVKKYYPIIKKEIEKAGLDIDAGALTTQLALESGWGDSSLASKYNNFGGYKSTKDGLKTAPLTTREYFTDKEKEKWEKDPDNTIIEATGRVKGNKKEYKVKTPFKAFATPEEGIAAQIKLISKERYAKHGTTKSGGDPKKYFDAVAAGGYATSPTYAQKNLSLYNSEILPILEDKFKYIADKEERDQFEILEERLQQIDLTGETEETIVPALNHLLGEYGFKFEQTAIGSDAVKITAPKLDRDGNKIEKVVNFDSLFQKLIGIEEVAFDRDPYEKEIADFVKENRDISIRVEQNKKKIINEKELKQVTEDFNIEAKEYEQLVKQLNQEAAVLTKEADTYKKGVPGYEDYLKRKREYDVKTKDLLSLKENLVEKGKEYDAMVGEYHIMRREGGNFFAQSFDQLKSSVGKGTSYIANMLMHQLAVNNPAMFAKLGTKEFKYGKEEKYVNPFSKIATKESRDTEEGAVEFIKDLPFKVLGRSSTKEYLEDYQQAPLFSAKGVGNVWFSVLEFVPAAKAKLLGTIALSANYVLEEMQDSPEFDDVSEGEQLGVASVIGSVVGVLENLGFRNIMQSKAFTKLSTAIASKVMLRNPATRRTFNEYVEQEVKSLMGKGALRMLAGGTAEFETGALQEASEMSLKYVYNQMKGSDLFETPEDWREVGYQILMGGIAEAMGGMMMATPKAMSYAFGTDDLSEVDDKTFKMFKEMSKDPKYLDFVTTKLQQQVVNQEITKDEMKKILTDYNRLNGAMQKMPDGIAPKYQKRLLGLFMQHQKLKDNMKNTDDVFNKEDKKKLAQIENRIDAVLKENKVEKEVDEVLNTPAEESKVFYAEKLEDIPEQHRDKAEKVEDDDTEISFRTNRFGLPIGKVKSTKVGEYYKYTLDGAEIEQTIEENTEEVVEEAQEETKGASNLKSAGQAAAKKWNIEKRKKGKKDPEERTVGNAIGAKVTMNGERGVIKEDPLNPNTIIFESLELEEDISPLQKEVETLSKTVEDIEEGALKQRIQGQLDSKKEELDRRKKRKRKVIEIGNIQEVMLKPLSEFEIKEDREISGRFFSSEEGDFKVVKQSKGKKGELFIVLEDMNFQKKKDSVNERLRKGEITKKEALNEIKELEKNKTKKYTGDKAFDILKKSRERGKKQDPYGYFRDKTPRGTARTVPEKVSVIMGDSTVPKEKYKQYERIVDMAIKAMNALSKALPNVRILLHANSDTFTEETKKKNVRGLFDPKTNIIHINLPKANLRTVGHEVLHAILVNRLKTDKKVGAVVDEMITSIKKAVNPKVAKELEAFTKRYKGKIKNEEYIAELFGILSERANSLSPKAKNIIAEFIQKLRELFNLPSEASVSDQEVVDFLNTLALRVGQGQVIEEEALSLLEDVDKKVTAKKRKQKTLPPKIQKLKDEGMLEGIYDFLQAGEMELAEQVLKGAGVTMDEFMTEDTFIDMLKDSKGKTSPEVLDRMVDDLGGTYEAEKLVMKAHAKTFNRTDQKTGEPLAVITPSGDAFVRLSNGSYKSIGTEPPFSLAEMYDSFDALLGEEYQEASYVSELSPDLEAKIISGKVSPPILIGEPTPTIREQKGDNIQEFINELNSQGYTNSEIKQFLIDEMGYTKAEAEALFPKTKTPPVKKKTKKKTPVKKKSKKKAISQKAKYAQERKEAKSNRTKAKKALPKKFGISKRSFFDSVQKILSVNVDMLPNELLEKYNNVVKNFAVWKKIPRLSEITEVIKETEELLGEIQDVLKNQIKKVRKPKDKKKAAELKEKNIQEILKKKENINNTLENKYEKALADVLLSVTKAELELMSDENVADLNALLDQIEDGVMSTYYAGKLQVVIEGKIRGGNVLLSKVNMQQFKDFLINGVGRAFSKLKSLITKKVPLHELIRSNLLGSIDNILGNYNAKDIYNKTFGKLETPHEQYTNEMDVISTKLQKFNELISGGKIFKKLTNKQVLSRAKVMASLLQDEYLANSVVKKDSEGNIERDENGNPRMISPKGVASAVSYIDGTIEKLKKGDTVDAEQIKILRELKKEIVKNGKIVITLTKKEQAAKKIIKEINEGLTEKMRYASALRGKKPTIYLDYVHHSAVTTTEEDMMKTQMEMFEVGEKQGRVSTEAGTGYERTNNKAISFDPAFSAYMGAKQTLLDFHMSQPIKEVRASIQALENSTEDSQSDAGTQLMKAFNEALEIVLSRNLNYTGFGRKFANGLRKSAYYAMLASVPRAGAELVTNLDYALISDPVGFTKGATEYFYLSKGMEGAKLMYQVKSAVTSKNYSTEALSGRHAQASILSKTSFDPSKPTGKAKEIYEFIKQNTVAIPFLKTTANTIAEKLIATPDKALARPLWFGRFFSELESLTDRKFSKKEILEMANGDSKLLTTYKKEIELARRKADEANVRMSSSANPFNVRLKDQVRYTGKDAGGFKNTWRFVNTFMTNFIKNENNTVKEGIIALIHSGEISRAEGAALIIAATTRMAGYVVLYTMTKNMFYPLFQPIVDNLFGFGDDDDDKDEKIDWEEMQQLATRQLAGSIAQIFTRGSLGNIPYLPISWGTEEINNQYLSSLRGEDPYDGFKHALVFSMVSLEDIKKKSLYSNLASMTGPASVYLKSLEKTYQAAQMASTAKKQKTRDYYKKYLLSRTIIDIATAFDFLPFYKDIRKMIDDGLWKFKQQNNKKKGMTLTKAQKKKYMPELYKMEEEMDKMYKNTDLYKMQQKMKADQKLMKEQILKQLYK